MAVIVSAGRRRVRHGAELRDPGRTEYTAHAGTAGPLSAQPPGQIHTVTLQLYTVPTLND